MTETSSVLISFASETSLPSPWSWPQARVPVHSLSSSPGHLRLTWFLYPRWRAGQAFRRGEGRRQSIRVGRGRGVKDNWLSNPTTRALATLEATWEQSPGSDL